MPGHQNRITIDNMTISAWDRFTGYNWERYASVCGGITAVLCIGFAIINWLFKYNAGIGAFTFFVGFLVAFWETSVYNIIGPCKQAKTFCMETVKLNQPVLRGLIYILLAILPLIYKTPCIAAGIFLLLTALLSFFAQCNKVADAADGTSNLQTNLNNGANQA